VHGVIALVIYEPVAGEEKRRAELVPTRVLMDNEEASVVLIHYYEAKPLVLAL
jgi:hypothetical protein